MQDFTVYGKPIDRYDDDIPSDHLLSYWTIYGEELSNFRRIPEKIRIIKRKFSSPSLKQLLDIFSGGVRKKMRSRPNDPK